MSSRIRLGLMFSYREDWIGGSYYLLNLISALKLLGKRDAPELTVFAFSNDELDLARGREYPDAKYQILHEPKPSSALRLANRVTKKLTGRLIRPPAAIKEELDVIYPAGLHPRYRNIANRLFWLPDFQEEYLPEMFGRQKVENRRNYRARVAKQARHIVFSSKDAEKDFRRFYPDSKAVSHVLNFAVSHPDYEVLDIRQLRRKYSIGNRPYFLVSNQFWKHKNHELVLEAIRRLAEKHRDQSVLVCFTGKEKDARNPEYFNEIRSMVERYELEDSVRFLGFIDREEQLALMKGSEAVIQPSLFEGWSTVIEDAKSLSVPVIASDLPVHLEQLGKGGVYFPRADSGALAEKMHMELSDRSDRAIDGRPYKERVEAFGRHFVQILRRVLAYDQVKSKPDPASAARKINR